MSKCVCVCVCAISFPNTVYATSPSLHRKIPLFNKQSRLASLATYRAVAMEEVKQTLLTNCSWEREKVASESVWEERR